MRDSKTKPKTLTTHGPPGQATDTEEHEGKAVGNGRQQKIQQQHQSPSDQRSAVSEINRSSKGKACR